MTATELTALIGSVTALIAAVVLPLLDKWSRARKDTDKNKIVTTASVMEMIAKERDRLQVRLERMEAEHAAQIAALRAASEQAIADTEAKWRRQHEQDQIQIAQLHTEIDNLYRRLYQPPASRP